MSELSSCRTAPRIGCWGVGLAQDVRQAMHVPVKWPAFSFASAMASVLKMEELS